MFFFLKQDQSLDSKNKNLDKNSKSSSSSSRSNSTHNSNLNVEKRSEDSRQLIYGNPQFDFKHVETRTLECSQNLKFYKEEIIIKEINSNIRVNEIMEPIYGNLMSDKKTYNQMKYANDKKELKIGALMKKMATIELNENLENSRKRIAELINLIKEEKEKLFVVRCQSNSLLYMLDARKHDLVLKKRPVVEQLIVAPRLSLKTDKEIEDLSSKVTILNQIYVILEFFWTQKLCNSLFLAGFERS